MTIYLVQRRHWQFNDHIYVLEDASPVRAFESASDAEIFRLGCEDNERSDDGRWFLGEEGPKPAVDYPLFEVVAAELEP